MSIYFIHSAATNLTKIGFARAPWNRFVKARVDSPVPLVLLTIVEGGRDTEDAIHARFADLRVTGEWFRHEGALADMVGALPPFVRPVRAGIRQIDIVKATGWSACYVSQLLAGKRSISLEKAATVWRLCHVKIGPLECATDEDCAALLRLCPNQERNPGEAAA